MPRQERDHNSALMKELDADSVFDPLASLSSQPLDSQSSASPDTTTGATGPKTPPHFSETLTTIPPFDLALLGLPAPMSPVTEGENALLNRGLRGLGQSSCSDSPMSMGSPAIIPSLALALKVRACVSMPALLDASEDSSEDSSNEDVDATDDSPRGETD